VAVLPDTLKSNVHPLLSVKLTPDALGWKARAATDPLASTGPASPHVTVTFSVPLQGAPTKLARGSLPPSPEPPSSLPELPPEPEPAPLLPPELAPEPLPELPPEPPPELPPLAPELLPELLMAPQLGVLACPAPTTRKKTPDALVSREGVGLPNRSVDIQNS
jgi:hypothetical protein